MTEQPAFQLLRLLLKLPRLRAHKPAAREVLDGAEWPGALPAVGLAVLGEEARREVLLLLLYRRSVPRAVELL